MLTGFNSEAERRTALEEIFYDWEHAVSEIPCVGVFRGWIRTGRRRHSWIEMFRTDGIKLGWVEVPPTAARWLCIDDEMQVVLGRLWSQERPEWCLLSVKAIRENLSLEGDPRLC